MADQIYLVNDDDTLKPMTVTPYASEDLLQRLLERYPDLLAGEQVNPDDPRRWMLIKREASVTHDHEETHRWRLDHLFLDQDGVPTLVETKIASNPELRREVVGQMLDYASNIIEDWSAERIQREFETRCAEAGHSPEETLDAHLSGDAPGAEAAIERFWIDVKTNLEAGRIRLVFVADKIPSSLLRIVEFLNGQMDPCEVLAVELRQFLHEADGETIRTLVPRVFGTTATARHRKQVSRTINDPGKYILEPVADELEHRFGMHPRRRMYRKGWTRMDHPGGPGDGEWLIYQNRAEKTLNIWYDGGSSPITLDDQRRIVATLGGSGLPSEIRILPGVEKNGAPSVRACLDGFDFENEVNWDELRSKLYQVMEFFLQAVSSLQQDPDC